MQRVRIGLTGLAGVLVLVLFAAAVLGLRSSDPIATAGGSRAAPHTAATREAPKDPLAELGVTPGGSGSYGPPATQKPAPPPATTPAPRRAPPSAPR